MRRINSEFRTNFISEEGLELTNKDYFGYAEMEEHACYVLADSLDEEPLSNSAQAVVESLIRSFSEAPTMSRRKLKKYMLTAHRELRRQQGGIHLKASVVMVVTDYQKVRYCHAGNSRFYLLRNGRILLRTEDQSLTGNLIREKKLSVDRAAAHEERNNLYSCLGGRGTPEISVSKKHLLADGDTLYLMSRGVWEACGDQELLDISKDAKEPTEILEQVEDLILGKQETYQIDNYTLAVTFIDKVYRSPKKKVSVKTVLMIAVPLLLAAGGISLGLWLRHRNIRSREESLAQCMESGEAYIKYDNYVRAAEEYTEAKKLADGLKNTEISEESGQYQKLSEQICLADEALREEEYQKAQELYRKARDLSWKAGNVGKAYIESRLEETEGHLELQDLMELGTRREESGDRDGAIEAYREARKKAAALYDADIKAEALEKQAALEAQIAEEKQEEEAERKAEEEQEKALLAEQRELENEQKSNDQKNAIDLENKGNELLAEGKYDNAVTYYRTAQSIYKRLELSDRAAALEEKIAAARAGLEGEVGP